MNWVTIDPGISGTGVAFFYGKNLITWGTYRSSRLSWEKCAYDLAQRIFWGYEGKVDKAFCEWPTGRFSSDAGLAAHNSDAILKLSFLIGNLNYAFGGIELIKVQTWKGQLPKELTQKRAEKFFKKTGFKSHAADAVGIGQYCIEKGLV